MEINKPENVIFKKTHAKSKITLEDLSFMRDKDDRSLLDKTREDIVILQVMPLERHGALIEYVAAEDYKAEPNFPRVNIALSTAELKKMVEATGAQILPLSGSSAYSGKE